MTYWNYANGQLEARSSTGVLLLVIQADQKSEFFVDLLNVNRLLSQLLLISFGVGSKFLT